jgi:hypothetical protein
MGKRSIEVFRERNWTADDERDLARLRENRRAWQRREAAAAAQRRAQDLHAALVELDRFCEDAAIAGMARRLQNYLGELSKQISLRMPR